MNDLISRQAAIDEINHICPVDTEYDCTLLDRVDVRCVLSDLPPAGPRWIPCSEMPDTDRNVFIARGTPEIMTVCVGHYQHDYEQWYEDRNWFAKCLYDGLYWCEIPPLPEPYKGGRDADR